MYREIRSYANSIWDDNNNNNNNTIMYRDTTKYCKLNINFGGNSRNFIAYVSMYADVSLYGRITTEVRLPILLVVS